MGKSLTRLIKKKRERTQINKIRNERVKITTHTTKIQRIIRNYYDNQGKMGKFLEKYNLPKLNQEEVECLNGLITISETEAVTKNSWQTKALDQTASQANFTNLLGRS